VKYAFIERHRRDWPVSIQCSALDVSARGFQQYLHRAKMPDKGAGRVSDMALLTHIKAIHAEIRGAYGWPRIWRELRQRGIRVGKERVRKMMRDNAIRARSKRKYKATTDSHHGLPVSDNLLNRNFQPERPDLVWTGDITYIATQEGWLYLAVVIDLFSRQVVGWAMGERMTRHLVIDALTMAWFRRQPAKGLIFHSDQGSQYASADFQATLRRYGIRGSMSRRGNCWDHAVTETLFGSLKVERLHGMGFETRRQAKDEVVDWLTFYSRKRMHSTLGYTSPMAFEENWRRQQETLAA
jgi:putative transposase